MSKKRTGNTKKPSTSQGVWGGMWRTIGAVLIASMNKGLFLPACIFFLLMVMLVKTPADYMPVLWSAFADYREWGYILAVAAVTGWGMNVRYLRRIHYNEVERLSAEKKQLQEERAGRLMKTSGDPEQ